MRRVARLYGALVDNYGQSADDYIPTCASALESANSQIESVDFKIDSNAGAANVGVWVWPLMVWGFVLFIEVFCNVIRKTI